VIIAIYLLNRSLSRVLEKRMTPFEVFYNKKPQIGYLRIFDY
jgi:hypothetical protein